MDKNINLEEIEKQTGAEIEKLKTSAGTIRRTVGLIINGVIQIAGVAMGQEILVNEGIVNNIIGYTAIALTVLLVGYQFWCAWKNNSFTKKAKTADLELKAMKENIDTIATEEVKLDEGVKTISKDEVKYNGRKNFN